MDDPVAIEINADAALLLKDLVGIDSYPPVLALLPNVYRLEDRERVHEVVAEQLNDAGVLVEGGRVHPVVEQWLHCLYRPDAELVVRIVETGSSGMLRMSLVRAGSDHVLAVRNDDHVVIQSVFQEGATLEMAAAVVISAMGPLAPLSFEPWRVGAEQLGELPADRTERRRVLVELGAQPKTAAVLSRAFEETVRRAEVLVVEHHDGSSPRPRVCVTVLDSLSGRTVVTPGVTMDGEVWSTYLPGDAAAIRAGINTLVDLLPGESWFETSRIT